MKPLIDESSALYLKRLARELNSNFDGFYASVATFSVRCNRARYSKGKIEVHSFAVTPEWFTPAHNNFIDVYSRPICASRKA